MGEALLAGLLSAGWPVTDLRVVEKLAARADDLRSRYPGLDVASSPGTAAGHVIAVKPNDTEGACVALAAVGDRTPVLSIAAGVPIGRMERLLPPGTPVVRAMPNTPALVGAGAAAIAGGSAATDEHLGWASSILGAVGEVTRVSEPLLDAVTGLSGSGPAYVFLVVEALVEGGVLVGLPREVSRALVTQTVLGAAKLLAETGEGPEALRTAVTSPGGTTAAGLRVLEQRGVRAAFLDAVAAATDRSRELGRS